MTRRLEDARILMYSHDTFGLGHLRRCRTIAHSLVEDYRGLQVLIISGATIAGAFDYRARVDFVKIPSVIKLRNGQYESMDQHMDLHDTLQMRKSIIRHTAETFQPDIFIVDKEPMGLEGEVEETLAFLKSRGATLVLGLREVMDSPRLLQAEWERKQAVPKIAKYYDEIWVYGPPDFYDPLVDLDVPEAVRKRMNFVGFLQRNVPKEEMPGHKPEGDYILVTTGGGGDGAELVHNVIHAYQQDPELTHRALMVLGPYMPAKKRRKLIRKGRSVPYLEVIEFDNRMEELVAGAKAVVAMGGYNTYCEILSFDKPALIVPRVQPREEQLIRAQRATELGLVDMLLPEQAEDPLLLAAKLKSLPTQPAPSKRAQAGLRLEGLPRISELVGHIYDRRQPNRLMLVKG